MAFQEVLKQEFTDETKRDVSEEQYSHRGLRAHSLYSPNAWEAPCLTKNPHLVQQ